MLWGALRMKHHECHALTKTFWHDLTLRRAGTTGDGTTTAGTSTGATTTDATSPRPIAERGGTSREWSETQLTTCSREIDTACIYLPAWYRL